MSVAAASHTREVLSGTDWNARRTAHLDRVEVLIGAYLQRRSAGHEHPVLDFLFTYYSLKPSHLRRWHPGFGVALTGDGIEDYHGWAGYIEKVIDGTAAVTVSVDFLERRSAAVDFVSALTGRTATRPAQLGCFGLHEWAMVYRGGPEALRHDVPLRLGAEGTDAVVDSMPLRCTHYDAFRFFTPDAAPLNAIELTPEHRLLTEQPGCLHASMDLYKWVTKLGPLLPSELLTDCFAMSVQARELDMRASPYDLSEYGYSPVRIETPAGRAEYVRGQSAIAEVAAELRARISASVAQLARFAS